LKEIFTTDNYSFIFKERANNHTSFITLIFVKVRIIMVHLKKIKWNIIIQSSTER